jgi:Neurotransmitter-gated ion-channel transmembrane region
MSRGYPVPFSNPLVPSTWNISRSMNKSVPWSSPVGPTTDYKSTCWTWPMKEICPTTSPTVNGISLILLWKDMLCIIRAAKNRTQTSRTTSSCGVDLSFTVSFSIQTKWTHGYWRNGFIVFNLILPCVLITGIALMSFYMPSDSGEKVTLGITTLLSMTGETPLALNGQVYKSKWNAFGSQFSWWSSASPCHPHQRNYRSSVSPVHFLMVSIDSILLIEAASYWRAPHRKRWRRAKREWCAPQRPPFIKFTSLWMIAMSKRGPAMSNRDHLPFFSTAGKQTVQIHYLFKFADHWINCYRTQRPVAWGNPKRS